MDNYYAMIFEPINIDVGHVVLRPLGLAKGIYDEMDNSFIADELLYEEASNYPMPGITHDMDVGLIKVYNRLTEEDKEPDDLIVFAFPISERELKLIYDGVLDIDAYEELIRGYGFSLIYDEKEHTQSLVAHDLETHKIYLDLDGSLDLNTAIMNSAAPISIEAKKTPILTFNPDELERQIKADVKGQDEVIEALVNTIYINIKYGIKSNLLILGPTGNGKTEIVRSLAEHLNRPLFMEDATRLSATGYHGKSTSGIMSSLLTTAGGSIEAAQHGIVDIEEIDKLASVDCSESVSKGDVQDEFLRIIEGDKVEFEYGQPSRTMTLDTSNIIFICTGAATQLFENLREGHKSIGFARTMESSDNPDTSKLTINDLEKFGFKIELLGRLEEFLVINKLTVEDYIDILENGTNSVLKKLVKGVKEKDDVDIVYGRDYLEEVAKSSAEQGLGARGLKAIVLRSLKPGIRYIRNLLGEGGTLTINRGTVHNPNNFELVSKDGTKVYSKLLK